MRSALQRHKASAALVLSLLAVVLTFTGAADAARQKFAEVVSKPKKHAVLKLGANAKFPSKAIPKVAAAKDADTVGGKTQEELTTACSAESVDLGTWCLMASPYPVPNEEIGKNDFFYATQKCVEEGGYLPTAAQLVGAAKQVKLASTLDDDRLTASIDEDATDGRKDRREMSATLVTTQAGSSAAGSAGVTDGARGDAKTGEPDPTPAPPSPAPESLQYVTVYDNRDRGGFAGSRPVSQPETFRCAFDKAQGQASDEGE
ncbi:MAG TPA: hypothetical protein VN238_18725 [Solirubrobacteraceae bacterium]|nr:hypothetical protein [Solirubrobacteraceae bacterium]